MNKAKRVLFFLSLFTMARGGFCAMNFNGSTQYVSSIGVVSAYNFVHQTAIFSITARIKLNNNTSRQTICGNNRGSSADAGFSFFYETIGGGNGSKALRILVTKANSPPTGLFVLAVNSGTDTITDTNSHFVAVTSTGPATTAVQFYVDGVSYPVDQNGTFPSSGTGNTNATNAVAIGSLSPLSSVLPMNGSIEDLAIYNRVLSQNEILSLALSRMHNFITTGRVGYWPMDEGTFNATASGNNTVLDRSGNANNGSPIAGPTWTGSNQINYQ